MQNNWRIITALTVMTISLQSNAQAFFSVFVSDGGMCGYLSLRCTVEGLSVCYMVRFISFVPSFKVCFLPSFFFKFIHLFVAVLVLHCCAGFSLVAASRDYFLVVDAGFSSQRTLLLQSMGSGFTGFSSRSVWAPYGHGAQA